MTDKDQNDNIVQLDVNTDKKVSKRVISKEMKAARALGKVKPASIKKKLKKPCFSGVEHEEILKKAKASKDGSSRLLKLLAQHRIDAKRAHCDK